MQGFVFNIEWDNRGFAADRSTLLQLNRSVHVDGEENFVITAGAASFGAVHGKASEGAEFACSHA